ncbi:hypothetical protein KIN20_006455 [Parelaphostrongylus tenuis]|uniref:Right handed beta helix domain-containing protein n=1 Tax=Parelaphostrongylus tenuis TaxID=148309 RepID=A0AAD5M1T6_PARTN|nr:hypothetical protein KIN20_006455 [Parelaphostrongylus tenuis]
MVAMASSIFISKVAYCSRKISFLCDLASHCAPSGKRSPIEEEMWHLRPTKMLLNRDDSLHLLVTDPHDRNSRVEIEERWPTASTLPVEHTQGLSGDQSTNECLVLSFIGTKGDVWLESCLSASNHRDGFHLSVAGNVTVLDSHSISNGQHGFSVLETSPSVLIQQSVSHSNAANGIRFSRLQAGWSHVKLNDVNVTDHYYAAAIFFEDAFELHLNISHCFIEENHNSGIMFDGVTANSSIIIVDSNFTRNRGSTILMSLLRDVDVELRRTTFLANNLNDFDQHEAVIDIATFAERRGVLSRRYCTLRRPTVRRRSTTSVECFDNLDEENALCEEVLRRIMIANFIKIDSGYTLKTPYNFLSKVIQYGERTINYSLTISSRKCE